MSQCRVIGQPDSFSKRAPSTTRTSLRVSGINSSADGGDPARTDCDVPRFLDLSPRLGYCSRSSQGIGSISNRGAAVRARPPRERTSMRLNVYPDELKKTSGGKMRSMRAGLLIGVCVLGGLATAVAQQGSAPRSLNIYYIDTEGGQSTLFVGPTGESLLVDTGNAGARDLERIVAAIADAGVKQIDHMWTTHYHVDHVGTMEELAKRVPMKHFYDHGPASANDRAISPAFLPMYEALSQGKRTTVKPGDKVAMAGLDITTVA